MNRAAHDEVRGMMVQYLAGNLDPVEVGILNAKLKADDALLREAARVVLTEIQLGQIGAELRCRLPAVATRVGARVWFIRFLNRLSELPRKRVVWGGGLAVVAAALLFAVLPGFVADAPRLLEVRGAVTLVRAGDSSMARDGVTLKPGDRLRVKQQASALLAFPRESSVVRLGSGTDLQIGPTRKGKLLLVQAGSLAAVIGPQRKESPLRIVTSNAQATVLGTKFALTARPQSTTLEVWQGRVAFAQAGSKDVIAVGPREFAIAQTGVSFVAQPIRLGLLREFWLGIPGSDIAELTNDPRFPLSPTGVEVVAGFELMSRLGDTHGSRLRGYLRPWMTGDYAFWIAGDDSCEFWLSKDDDPANKVRICRTREWTKTQEFDKSPEQKSSPVRLEIGGRYYVEALHKQSAGAESLAVAWQPPHAPRELIPHDALTTGNPETASPPPSK